VEMLLHCNEWWFVGENINKGESISTREIAQQAAKQVTIIHSVQRVFIVAQEIDSFEYTS
jgi:hypothetical protein